MPYQLRIQSPDRLLVENYKNEMSHRLNTCERGIEHMDKAVLLHEVSMVRQRTLTLSSEQCVIDPIDRFEEAAIQTDPDMEELRERHRNLSNIIKNLTSFLEQSVSESDETTTGPARNR